MLSSPFLRFRLPSRGATFNSAISSGGAGSAPDLSSTLDVSPPPPQTAQNCSAPPSTSNFSLNPKGEKQIQELKKRHHEKKIFSAALDGKKEELERCLNAGINPNIKTVNGETPLFFAIQTGDLSVIELLISKGAEVNVKTKMDQTLMHAATAAGGDTTDLLSFLVSKGLKVNCSTYEGHGPLHIAVKYGFLQKAKWLLENRVDVNKEDSGGSLALHYALLFSGRGNRTAIIELLLKCPKVKLNKLSRMGDTPLHLAMLRGDLEAMQLLVRAGAKVECKFCDRGKLCQGMRERDLQAARCMIDNFKSERKKKS